MSKPELTTIAIHGAPRSGTSWTGQLFNSSEHVAYRYQPLFSYAYKGRLGRHSSESEVRAFLADLSITDDDFVLQRGKASLSGYTLEFSKTTATHMVYKEVRYHEVLHNLLEKSPSTLGIGIIRDPRSVIHSWMKAPREFDPAWSPDLEWRDAPSKNSADSGNWYGFERWKELALLFEALSNEFPHRFTIVRYEDLSGSPSVWLKKLFAFCSLPLTPQVRRFIADSSARNDRSPYGVFRDHQEQKAKWIDTLDPGIVQAIEKDTLAAGLGRYLS